jgi:hypothetical protein
MGGMERVEGITDHRALVKEAARLDLRAVSYAQQEVKLQVIVRVGLIWPLYLT